jgi:hypothetical protein
MEVELFWNLPGPSRFLGDCRRLLHDRRSFFVVVPGPLHPPDLRHSMLDGHKAEHWYEADLEDFDAAVPPDGIASQLHRLFGLEGDERDSHVASFVTSKELEGVFIWLDARRASKAGVDGWCSFLSEFTKIAKDLEVWRRPTVVTACAAATLGRQTVSELPVGAVSWRGRLRRIDTEVYVAERQCDLTIDVDPVIAASVVEIGAFDLELVDSLLEHWDGDPHCMQTMLAEYAEGRGWCEDRIREAKGAEGSAASLLDDELSDAWSVGAVDVWDSSTVRLHAALQDEQATSSALWRAQLRTLFPLIEKQRARLSLWAAEHPLLSGLGSREEILEMELSLLAPEIRRATRLSAPVRYELAGWLRKGRNRLAHTGLLSMEEIRRGRELIEKDERSRP